MEKCSRAIATNLTSIFCVRLHGENCLTTHTKECSIHTNSESCNFELIIYLIFFVYKALKTTTFCPLGFSPSWNHRMRNIMSTDTWRPSNRRLNYIIYKINKIYYDISTMYECIEKKLMSIGCNIWIICLDLNSFFYNLSLVWMLYILSYELFLTIFFFQTQQIEVRLIVLPIFRS